jgi:hypothetical protein
MTQSVYTPLQLDAAAGLLQNQGLAVNAAFITAMSTYNALPAISPLLATITAGASVLTAPNLAAIKVLGASNCPALGDSVPSAYSSSVTVSNNPAGFTGALLTLANTYMGNGDLTKFAQAVAIALAYATSTNQFINSAVNSTPNSNQNYLCNTFSNMNDTMSGDITSVNLATGAFGNDLANLGRLMDLSNLDNLGTPLALVQRISSIVGNVPVLAIYFIAEGVPQEVVVNLNDPTVSVDDSAQKLMYQAMTKIVNTDLAQILQVLGVTTPGINTMADLLNPVKLFPTSFQSLTAPTANGPRAIYIDSAGTVNSSLSTALPPYVLSSLI